MKTKLLILFAAIALPVSIFAQNANDKLSTFSTQDSENTKDYCFTLKS